MSVLKDKNILLGITGGIAAYKTATLVRLLIKAGANIKVIMTPAAKEFVTPLTLSTLSKNPVYSDFTSTEEDGNPLWNNHVDLALWADFMLIAPATANTISKLANGNCDNFLVATYLSSKCIVFYAPAMDLDMYKHPTTLDNLSKLTLFGNVMIPAEKGELASGLYGEGRMAEPENILAFLENYFLEKSPLKGKKILITAGPTYEPIDPVRFIGNHSSGKMGLSLANQAYKLGAEVILIMGPSHLAIDSNFTCIRVNTAQEMFLACEQYFEKVDVFIASAAVADYRPKEIATHKIKKAEVELSIDLERNIDILSTLGLRKKNQIVVGFALETENEFSNAKQKIEKKNLDLIVLNSLNDEGAGFGHETNKVSIISSDGKQKDFELKTKDEVALDIINTIIEKMHA